jgi:hypothetical protein
MFDSLLGKKNCACSADQDDANRLTHHPRQKASGKQLLSTAEIPVGETAMSYLFGLGSDKLIAGAGSTFQFDRADTKDCAGLVADRNELAAIRHT